jgi:FMN reductase
MARILGVSGSLRDNSHTYELVRIVLESASISGAETSLLDLREHPLPMFEAHRDYATDRLVQAMLAKMEEADGFIVGSPEYHGCMSGATKNFFDFLYREIAGKLFGLVAAAGGSQGTSCFNSLRTAVLYCHGWTLPYFAAGSQRDFDADGKLVNDKVLDRLQRLGRDVAVYAPLLRHQFQRDLSLPPDAQPGFASWMA